MEIKFLFAGDFIPQNASGCNVSEELLAVLKDKDFSVVNLEAPLTDSELPISKIGCSFKVCPESVANIKSNCFDAVALANNHVRDYGDEGVLDLLKNCQANNIKTVGAGKNFTAAIEPLRVTIKGKQITILNYCEQEFNIASEKQAGANPFKLLNAYYDIQKERKHSDYIIVVYHGGVEYQYYPTLEMVNNFKFMVDIGADCIVSHHTHRYGGVIRYKDKPILFGTGNYLASTISKVDNSWLIGLIAKITINDNSISCDLFPIKMDNTFNNVGLLFGKERDEVLNHIHEISDLINDENRLLEYWERENLHEKTWAFNILKSRSNFEYRLRKYLPFLFSQKISKYKLMNILNILRCESHRNKMICILEATYNQDR